MSDENQPPELSSTAAEFTPACLNFLLTNVPYATLAHASLLTADYDMTLAFAHVLQLIDPCAGTRGTTICVLNASCSTHHHNMRQIIGLQATNQHADLALIVATCTTLPTTAATAPFVPFEQTNSLPPHPGTHSITCPKLQLTTHVSLLHHHHPHLTQHKILLQGLQRWGMQVSALLLTPHLQQVQRHLPQEKRVWMHPERPPCY